MKNQIIHVWDFLRIMPKIFMREYWFFSSHNFHPTIFEKECDCVGDGERYGNEMFFSYSVAMMRWKGRHRITFLPFKFYNDWMLRSMTGFCRLLCVSNEGWYNVVSREYLQEHCFSVSHITHKLLTWFWTKENR